LGFGARCIFLKIFGSTIYFFKNQSKKYRKKSRSHVLSGQTGHHPSSSHPADRERSEVERDERKKYGNGREEK
jgi:hypothetical protein